MIEHLHGKGLDVNEISDYEEMLLKEREVGLGTALHGGAAQIDQVEAVGVQMSPKLRNALAKTALELAREEDHE